jgi:hypothetical protein
MISSDDDSEEEKRKEREIDVQTRSPALGKQIPRMEESVLLHTAVHTAREKEKEREEKEREDSIFEGLMQSLESENSLGDRDMRRMSDDDNGMHALNLSYSQLEHTQPLHDHGNEH